MSNEPPDRKDELASNDDAIVGRAFRRSLVVLLLVGAVVAGISFLLERKQSAPQPQVSELDRKSTRLNSSHLVISYAVFCLKKKKRIRLRQSMEARNKTDKPLETTTSTAP